MTILKGLTPSNSRIGKGREAQLSFLPMATDWGPTQPTHAQKRVLCANETQDQGGTQEVEFVLKGILGARGLVDEVLTWLVWCG